VDLPSLRTRAAAVRGTVTTTTTTIGRFRRGGEWSELRSGGRDGLGRGGLREAAAEKGRETKGQQLHGAAEVLLGHEVGVPTTAGIAQLVRACGC
jgi:hypothetical protein